MATKNQLLQEMIRRYKESTGNKEIDMHEVARFAIRQGWRPPAPISAEDRLAKELSQSAREEHRRDPRTGRSYRVYHAVPRVLNGQTSFSWVDIDEAPRKPMFKSLMQRREQMVGDGLQLSLDADHWNSIHATEEPIVIPLDFTDDIEWRKNAPDDEQKAG